MTESTPLAIAPGRVVFFLRAYAGMTQAELAGAAGISQKDVSQYELGNRNPAEETLRRLSEAAGLPWEITLLLQRLVEALDHALERGLHFPEEARPEAKVAGAVWMAFASYMLQGLTPELTEEEQKAEAEEIWQGLRQHPLETIRRYLVEGTPEENFTPALAATLRTASLERAAESPEEGRELAELAAWVGRGIDPRR